jgi:hypothetical protein
MLREIFYSLIINRQKYHWKPARFRGTIQQVRGLIEKGGPP